LSGCCLSGVGGGGGLRVVILVWENEIAHVSCPCLASV